MGLYSITQAPLRSDPTASLHCHSGDDSLYYIPTESPVHMRPHPHQSARKTNPLVRNTAVQKEAAIAHATAGATKTGAARSAGCSRRTLYRWLDADLDFLMEFDAAWTQGEKRRSYLCWLNHPFRGLRPPTGKGTRSRPRFSR